MPLQFLSELLFTVVQMSVIAGFVGLIVMILRRSVGRLMPRTFSYVLWVIVLYRMIFPFSFLSVFSVWGMITSKQEFSSSLFDVASLKASLRLPGDDAQGLASFMGIPGEGIDAANTSFSGVTNGVESVNAMHLSSATASISNVILVLTMAWILGILVLLIHQGVSYWRLCKNMNTAVLFDGIEQVAQCKKIIGLNRHVRVYVSENAESPFVYGVLWPKVVLPLSVCQGAGAEGDMQRRYILLHELYHVKRWDSLVKSLAFLALCVHWFNPVLWMAFRIFDKDMEMSCDEGVVNALQAEEKADYALTLLQLTSVGNRVRLRGALAFRESHVGERVKHILRHKKAGIAAGVLSIVILLVCGMALLSDPLSFGKALQEGKVNILVIGRAEEADDPDTFLLLGYNAERKNVNVAFIPRDLLVDEQEGEGAQKLSGYAGIHAPKETVGAIGSVLGIEIHHYVTADTSVVRDLVDMVGGVEFDVPMRMVYKDPTQNLYIDLQQGLQVLNGEQAEMLVRFRHGYAEGDLDRIRVQRAFLNTMVEQKADLKLTPNKVLQLLSGRVETDIGVKTGKTLISLFREVQRSEGEIAFLEIPTTIDQEKAHLWMLTLTPEAEELLQENF